MDEFTIQTWLPTRMCVNKQKMYFAFDFRDAAVDWIRKMWLDPRAARMFSNVLVKSGDRIIKNIDLTTVPRKPNPSRSWIELSIFMDKSKPNI